MDAKNNTLPDDIEELKCLVVAQDNLIKFNEKRIGCRTDLPPKVQTEI